MTRDLQLVHYVPRSKGTMSEAELHLLRQRMEQGRRNKARRGGSFNHLPIGSMFLSSGEVGIDPGEQVQAVVRLIFDTFEELGGAGAVLRHLARNGIRIGVGPIEGPNRGQREWRRPNRGTRLRRQSFRNTTGRACDRARAWDRAGPSGSGRHS